MPPPQTPPPFIFIYLFQKYHSCLPDKIRYLFLLTVYIFKKVVRMSCAIAPVQIDINIRRQ